MKQRDGNIAKSYKREISLTTKAVASKKVYKRIKINKNNLKVDYIEYI